MRSVMLALAFGLVAGAGQAQVNIAAGTCAVIVASRPTVAQARDYARGIPDQKNLRVYQGHNGWYALSPSRIKAADADKTLRGWKSAGRIPADAYCTTGGKFVAEVDLKTGKPVGVASTQRADTMVIAERRDGWLNLRSGPGTSFKILRRMDNGLQVSVLDRKDGWARVRLASGETGWAALSGMASAKSATSASSPASTPAQKLWHGWGQQNSGSTWGMEVDLRPAKPLVRYPTIPCTAQWTPVSSSGGSTTYREKVTSGRCVDGQVTLAPLSGGRMLFSFADKPNQKPSSRAVLVAGPYRDGRKAELLALTTAHIKQSPANSLSKPPKQAVPVGAILALGVLGVIAKGMTSGGSGGSQSAAKYPDHFNTCLGVTQGDSYCYNVRSPDLKNLCLARAQRNESWCYSISDPDTKNLCLGISKASYDTMCYNIGNADIKNTCLAASNRNYDTFCYNIKGEPWRSICGGMVLSKNNCYNLN